MQKLTDILNNSDCPYELIYHEKPLRTAKEGADFFGVEIGQAAPTLIVKTEKGFVALIISGERGRLDFDSLAAKLSCRSVTLADRREAEMVTGSTVGSVPMVGLDIPCVIDKRLFKYPAIYGGTGKAGWTLKLSPCALEKLNRVVAMLD